MATATLTPYTNPWPVRMSASNGDPEIIMTDDNPINEYCLSNKVKREVTRPALDRAIKRIGAHTAQGLDGMPARLLKCLGDGARQADIFSSIIAREPIPEDWRCGRVILVPKRGGDAELLSSRDPLARTILGGRRKTFGFSMGFGSVRDLCRSAFWAVHVHSAQA
ncbi:hypothetical protein MRX96_008151 [Rhipicephalus microplus]